MALFLAYYDASGSQEAPDAGLTVAGLVAIEAKWAKFESKWQAVLDEFGVSAHHMKEFTGPAPNSEFAAWGKDKEKRARYLASLIGVVKLGVQKTFIVSIAPGVIPEVNKRVQVDECGYALAANVCRRYVELWIAKKHPRDALQHVFEAGDAGQDFLRDLAQFAAVMGALRFPLTAVPKTDESGRRLRPFEAADLIAWEARRGILDGRAKKGRPRTSLAAIAKTLPNAGTTITAERLLKICRKRPDLFPPKTE